MKKTQFILLSMLCVGLFFACDKHDSLDDNLIVGQIAPQVSWEVKSTTVDAGSNVAFTVQYYLTSEDKSDHLEVWYDVTETIDKAVSCPWVTTFTYSVTSSISEGKRIEEKAAEYPHQESDWNAALRAYSLANAFPTSVTLSTFSWVKPETFEDSDLDRIKTYFGESFPQTFRDGLYEKMGPADFEKMFQGLNLEENFREKYLELVRNDFSGVDEWLFRDDGSGNRPVPQAVKATFDAIPFGDLVQNTSTGVCEVEYVRSYAINAYLKVIDTKGNIGASTKTLISLN
jgi:hypothetical protein